MTSSDPEVIRRQIEDTRRELSYDVDALNEKVNPARVVDRRVTAAKGRITSVKERVMGSAQDTAYHGSGPGVRRRRIGAERRVQRRGLRVQRRFLGGRRRPAGPGHRRPPDPGQPPGRGPDRLRRRLARLEPPAGLGEGEAAGPAGRDAVKEHKDALLEPAKQAAQEIGDQLRPAAEQAVESVKATAQDAATTVTEEGKAAAADVQGQAQQSKETVQTKATNA